MFLFAFPFRPVVSGLMEEAFSWPYLTTFFFNAHTAQSCYLKQTSETLSVSFRFWEEQTGCLFKNKNKTPCIIE